MGWAVSTNGEKRNAYRIFVGKHLELRPLDSCRHMWKDNIKIYFVAWYLEYGWKSSLQCRQACLYTWATLIHSPQYEPETKHY
jgi:hypothetical protein